MAKFPINGCNPTPEEYEQLLAACNNPQPALSEYTTPPKQVDLHHESEKYQRLLDICRGEDKTRKKKYLPNKFQMSVDVDFDSPEYEEIKRQARSQMYPRKD